MSEVRLREWRLDDIGAISVMLDDERLRPWSSTDLDVDAWMRREISQQLGPTRAVCLDDDEGVIGRVALRLPEFASDAVRAEAMRPEDRPAGELSFWLVPSARGRGIAQAAVSLMMRELIAPLGLKSVVLDIEGVNEPSIRLAERLGAQRRAPTRVAFDRRGTPRLMVIYVLPVDSAG
jgi:[ribosomal protein S5]-alanine N-acetyltransferase